MHNKEFIKNFLENNKINITDLNSFLYDYSDKKGKPLTPEQLNLAVQFINSGQLDLVSLCKEVALEEKLSVVKITDKNGNFICYKVYEI